MATLRQRLAGWIAGPDGGQRAWTLQDADPLLLEALGYAPPTAAGVSVTSESAMRMSAVWACVRLIAESIASLPLHVYERDGEAGGRRRVDADPIGNLLHSEPNPGMTSFVFRECMSVAVLTGGNAYARIVRDNAARPMALLPMRAARVLKKRDGSLAYTLIDDNGAHATYDQADVLHVPGLSFDGITGVSPIRYAAQSIGLGLAAETFGASFFGNGSTPAGVIQLQGKLTKEQANALRESWQRTYGGASNANRTAVLYHGAQFNRISIPPNEAQFIETRRFQISDIARWYRVPPHMIGDLDRATFSNIEQQSLEFVQHTLRPWLVRFEQEFNRKLFPSTSNGAPNVRWCEFSVDGLLRGDVKSRSDYYVKGRQWGWLCANDVRALENMPPIEGGDEYLTPLNMAPIGSDPADNEDNGTGDGAKKEGQT